MRPGKIELTYDMTDLIKISAKSMDFLTTADQLGPQARYDAQYEALGWFVANMHIERISQSYWNGYYSNITLEVGDLTTARRITDDLEHVEGFEGFLSFFGEWACSCWYNLDHTAPAAQHMDGWFVYLAGQLRLRGYNVGYNERTPEDAFSGGSVRKSYWLEVRR